MAASSSAPEGVVCPRRVDPTERLTGIEAVVDKDLASAVLARDLHADLLIIATDVDGVYLDWGSPQSRRIIHADPASLDPRDFARARWGRRLPRPCSSRRKRAAEP